MKAKQKGARGENEVCKILMEWWTPHYQEAVFVKTPGSGGWGGGAARVQKMKQGMRASGDIMTTLEAFPFSVEVKRKENWSTERMLAGRPSPVWDWWMQCQRAAEHDHLIPMLWFRHNREPWSVFLPFSYVVGLPLPPPIAAWSRSTLLGVDHGREIPVMYSVEDLVGIHPDFFIDGAKAMKPLRAQE